MNKWISVKKQLPKQREHVLVFDETEGVCRGYCIDEGTSWQHYPLGSYASDGCLFDVTHWMPLPAPPKIGCAEHGHDWVKIPLGDGPDCRRCGAHG